MKSLILLFCVQISIAVNLPKLEIGDWWIIKYGAKITSASYRDIVDDSIVYGESPSFIMKFTVTDVDTEYYIITVETPFNYIQKEKCIYINNYPRYELYVKRDSFFLEKTKEFMVDQCTANNIVYKEHGLTNAIRNQYTRLMLNIHGRLFVIPMLYVNVDSFILPGLELPKDDDIGVADWCKEVMQQSKKYTLDFKSKQVNYKIIDLTQARFSVEQIWVDGFPWWLFHKGKKYKAELISSSFYSDEDIKALKELIKNDFEKRKSKEQ